MCTYHELGEGVCRATPSFDMSELADLFSVAAPASQKENIAGGGGAGALRKSSLGGKPEKVQLVGRGCDSSVDSGFKGVGLKASVYLRGMGT